MTEECPVKLWAEAISTRLIDESDFAQHFPEDACNIQKLLASILSQHPHEIEQMIGTGLIEEEYFDRLS